MFTTGYFTLKSSNEEATENSTHRILNQSETFKECIITEILTQDSEINDGTATQPTSINTMYQLFKLLDALDRIEKVKLIQHAAIKEAIFENL